MDGECYFNTLTLKLPTFRTTMSILYSATSFTAILLNIVVLTSIWKTAALRRPSFVLIANLAAVDLLAATIAEPLIIVGNVAALKGWPNLFCISSLAARVVAYWLGSVSLYILTVISLDRLFAIRLKNRYRSVVTIKKVKAVLIPWWITTFIAISTAFVLYASIRTLVIAIGTGVFVLLIILSISYSMSFHYLKKLSNTVATSEGTEESTDCNFNRLQYKRSLRTMLLLFCNIMVLYLPFFCTAATLVIIGVEEFDENPTSMLVYKLLMTSEFIVAVSTAVNPVMYFWRIQDLRKAIRNTLRQAIGLTATSHIRAERTN